MGTSVLTVRIVGNHGCQREVKDGEKTAPMCERGEACAKGCVDAVAKHAVEMLKATGSIIEANLHHWPDGDVQIVDNLKTGKRTGSF